MTDGDMPPSTSQRASRNNREILSGRGRDGEREAIRKKTRKSEVPDYSASPPAPELIKLPTQTLSLLPVAHGDESREGLVWYLAATSGVTA
jgi:hypothetical protein